eukprot:361612-Chlamydomonas_euryale.AAC.29
MAKGEAERLGGETARCSGDGGGNSGGGGGAATAASWKIAALQPAGPRGAPRLASRGGGGEVPSGCARASLQSRSIPPNENTKTSSRPRNQTPTRARVALRTIRVECTTRYSVWARRVAGRAWGEAEESTASATILRRAVVCSCAFPKAREAWLTQLAALPQPAPLPPRRAPRGIRTLSFLCAHSTVGIGILTVMICRGNWDSGRAGTSADSNPFRLPDGGARPAGGAWAWKVGTGREEKKVWGEALEQRANAQG